jgi:putative transposase
VYLKGYTTMIELTVGLAEYFTFYNSERPHQSLGQKTPDIVHKTAMGGGAMIIDKYPRAVDVPPVPLRSTGSTSTAESISEVPAEAKPGQRRPAVFEIECVA